MVWNKDLAKLKQDLKTEEGAGPKRPVPKPSPKPLAPKELEDEDALFLAAMGKRRKPTQLTSEVDAVTEEMPPAQPAPEVVDFKEAMSSLKGVKPAPPPQIPLQTVNPRPQPEPAGTEPPAKEAPPEESAAPQPAPPETALVKEAGPQRSVPALIQLAAGMAIEVDGNLDLRGHSPMDAIERLKERILDGHLLGWRTLHIQLGPSEELRKAFLDFLTGPEADVIARYAQAPIPMGGAQAWILYLGFQGSATH